ncbi:streptophobe family protein [Streptantibioticus silvisoli]|uniref:Streptophobe family protein n=1 Tax=Streptantibioticus silvisoli TaxID=2705255 RepID=A0ABT6VX62_9ACTN|nr:streptophobe family protein [Streptantibioticus silvisoli]MDI5963072.1 streptophobe family protein [Streptantibioticus silvisoli]
MTSDRAPRAVPWGRVVATGVAAVGWALLGMAAVAALGLHLLGTDRRAALGPSTAALVTMAVGGRVHAFGNVSAFGRGAAATGVIGLLPLGVALTGALLVARVFLRSLRGADPGVRPTELAARAAVVVALFTAAVAGLAWAGQDTVSLRGGPAGDGNGLPGGLAGLDGAFSRGLDTLGRTHGSVGFRVDTAASAGGGALWIVVVLALALAAGRRAPAGCGPVHRVVRPAVSAWCTVLLLAVAAGLAVAACAAVTDDHPARVAGGALLGTPNAVWFATTLGLFVPWSGRASGPLTVLLPDPLGRVLGSARGPVTVRGLAELDGRVWLLPVAAAVLVLAAGVLTAVRTPPADAPPGRRVARIAVRDAVAGAVALPALVGLTGFSVAAGLSAFGVDAAGAALSLHGSLGRAVLLGAAWGAAGGAAGGALALLTGTEGSRAARDGNGRDGNGRGRNGWGREG